MPLDLSKGFLACDGVVIFKMKIANLTAYFSKFNSYDFGNAMIPS